ncbi:MAG: CBS domain-containing protein [Oscillibacter sp.]|nr:CBS domain-containing protein [Oscillibacter sp.]
MNIAYFLLPKYCVTYLYDDQSFRQGLEKMRYHGYTAIPVINRQGQYVGTISEGDFLWQLFPDGKHSCPKNQKDLEKRCIRDLLREDHYPPVRITVSMEELVNSAMNQNFTPVVDDLGNFVGIITRRDVIRHLAENCEEKESEADYLKIV